MRAQMAARASASNQLPLRHAAAAAGTSRGTRSDLPPPQASRPPGERLLRNVSTRGHVPPTPLYRQARSTA
eukprot:4348005-Prymnesium_polylepis.1